MPPHNHSREQEVSYVLEGEIVYGITANPEWISELKARHGLRLLGE